MSGAVGDVSVARAPVRVGDVGGWTDTWFGSPGRVCHLAVGPGVEVRASLLAAAPSGVRDPGMPVRLQAPDLGEDYRFVVATALGTEAPAGHPYALPGRQPLLEQAVASVVERAAVVDGATIEIEIASAVPAGASLGTSAAVVVAILAALDALLEDRPRAPDHLATAGHEVETQRAGREAGVQDQWAAALGGCGLLAIGPYPKVRHRTVALAEETEVELADRLITVAFGPHDSSAVHQEVIDAVIGCGGAAHDRVRRCLGRLTGLADVAAAALETGEIDAWAAVLTESTEQQRTLHPALIGPAHQAAIDGARAAGAVGWKVNGAGGAGGSLTIVAGPRRAGGTERATAATDLAARLAALDPSWQILDLTPSPGVTVDRS